MITPYYSLGEAASAVLKAYDAERNMRPALEQLREALHGCRVRAIEELGAMARGEDVPAWRCPDCKCVNLEHESFCYRCGALGEDDDDDWRDYDHGFRDGYQAALRERGGGGDLLRQAVQRRDEDAAKP